MKINRRRPHAAQGGFSLAELMVVIVIIGLLATAVVPNLLKKLNSANTGKVKADLTQIKQAAEGYLYDHNGKWPDSIEQLVQRDQDGTAYLEQSEVPKDPWGNAYMYEAPRQGEAYPSIYTYGADGVRGGEGKDRDISYQDVIDGNLDG